MSYNRTNEKYEKILSRFGINGRIESVTGSAVPVQAIEERDNGVTIYLNIDEIEEKEYEAYAKAVVSCWQKNIGVELNGTVTVCEEADFSKKLYSGEFDTAICSMTLDSDNATEYLSMFTKDSSYNVLNYNSAEYDRIIKDLKANPTAEKAAYAESYLLKNAVLLPISTENSVFAFAKDVNGIYFAGDSSNIYFYKGQK